MKFHGKMKGYQIRKKIETSRILLRKDDLPDNVSMIEIEFEKMYVCILQAVRISSQNKEDDSA